MQALRLVEPVEHRPPLALELPPSTSFDEWVTIGRRLQLGSQVLNWHIGDWWAFGDHRYGERAKAAAEGIFGREFQTLMDMAMVARAYEPSRRREVLSFTHHREAASLPPEAADRLLHRAETEHLSTRDLRREVHALKAANDPQPAQADAHRSKSISPQSAKAELTAAYEMVIEFAEALEHERNLTRREQDLLTTALAFVQDAHAGHRPCPADFDVIFVEKGRIECEAWFTASRVTVNRWLIERGKKRLIEQRAEYVRFQREQAFKPQDAPDHAPVQPIDEALHVIAREAAHFLQISRYGGWKVTATANGEWLVGTVHKTSDALIAMAERQGFDAEAYRRTGVEG